MDTSNSKQEDENQQRRQMKIIKGMPRIWLTTGDVKKKSSINNTLAW